MIFLKMTMSSKNSKLSRGTFEFGNRLDAISLGDVRQRLIYANVIGTCPSQSLAYLKARSYKGLGSSLQLRTCHFQILHFRVALQEIGKMTKQAFYGHAIGGASIMVHLRRTSKLLSLCFLVTLFGMM